MRHSASMSYGYKYMFLQNKDTYTQIDVQPKIN